jgi:hypothetical protein
VELGFEPPFDGVVPDESEEPEPDEPGSLPEPEPEPEPESDEDDVLEELDDDESPEARLLDVPERLSVR